MQSIYVQYGSGFSVGKDWLNFDSSPTLRIERVPFLGSTLGRFAGNHQPFPSAVKYGDICSGLLAAENTVSGAYASHVLEHLSLEDCRTALRNTHQMLKPGGLFRLVVPDLQSRCLKYLDEVARGSCEAGGNFMRRSHLGQERRPRTILSKLRAHLGGSAHLWMWDEPSMFDELQKAGFVDIRRCDFGDCSDPAFAQVEERDRFIDAKLKIRELAVESRKPY